jgi:phosphatidylglycerophosphatase C
VPYVLGFLRSRPWRLAGLLGTVPALAAFLVGHADRGQLKSAFIRATLGGSRRQDLGRWTTRFVARLCSRGLFAEALERIAQHQRRGDRLVLMSASTDLYVPRIAEELGFAEVVCTELRWNGERLSGELASPNRRGAQKASAFRVLRERHAGLGTVAYGNARSDLAHLRLADEAFLVNGTRQARREAQRDGIACLRWRLSTG